MSLGLEGKSRGKSNQHLALISHYFQSNCHSLISPGIADASRNSRNFLVGQTLLGTDRRHYGVKSLLADFQAFTAAMLFRYSGWDGILRLFFSIIKSQEKTIAALIPCVMMKQQASPFTVTGDI